MTMKIKNKVVESILLRKPEVFSNRKLPVKTVYWLSRLERELIGCSKIYNEEKNKFIMDFCKKDEKGKPIIDPSTGMYKFSDEESMRSLSEKIRELLEAEIEINIDKLSINIDDLQGAISAEEMTLLEPCVNFL